MPRHVTGGARRLALLAMMALAAACGGPAVSPTSSPSPTSSASSEAQPSPSGGQGAPAGGIPTGCLGIELGTCLLVRDVAIRELGAPPEQPIVYARVGPFPCRGEPPCGANLVARPEGTVTLELGGREPAVVNVTAPGGEMQAAVVPGTVLIRVEPSSIPIVGPALAMELAHCGVGSGIDVDGSFWDPVGQVNWEHADFINAAHAQFTMTSPTTATLLTRAGLGLTLGRHPGPKYLELCD